MEQIYRSSDYQIAVTLHALGFKLLSVDKSEPRAIFEFEYNPQIISYIEAYFRDELSLNPRAILLSAKLVKDRLYSGT